MFDFGFNVGDIIYIAYPKYNKVCRFRTDCIKILENNVTAHGTVYGLYGHGWTPTEVSIKYLNKKFVFTQRKYAENWLKSKD